MSLQSWKAEFYIIDADTTEPENATSHSLLKWYGLRKENLDRHNLEMDMHGWVLREKDKTNEDLLNGYAETLSIDSTTCALCYHHLVNTDDEDDEEDSCSNCPLAIARDGIPCTSWMQDESLSPWTEWTRLQNPEPMIFWLKKAVEEAQAKV